MILTKEKIDNIRIDEIKYKGYYIDKSNDDVFYLFDRVKNQYFSYNKFLIKITYMKFNINDEYILKHIVFFSKDKIEINFYKVGDVDKFKDISNFINLITTIINNTEYESTYDELENYIKKGA